jgi:hypothetical protein
MLVDCNGVADDFKRVFPKTRSNEDHLSQAQRFFQAPQGVNAIHGLIRIADPDELLR